MSVEVPSLEARIAALEAVAADYSRKAEADERLTVGVERLAEETGGLNQILTRVDEQQQRLSTLGRDLARVERTVVSKEDLEVAKHEQEAVTLDFRKKTLTRIYTTGLLLVSFVLVVVATLLWYQSEKRQAAYQICLDRNAQNQIIVAILRGSIRDVPSESADPRVKNIQTGIQELERLIIDCGTVR